ncbi:MULTISPECIES: isoquinoline 1-oxidoreductase [unclassified Micromonospora]|uniref:isoquinoline 1-oxidoreductase n=1 Tax=unclassified Micromonospora TaxID=2617518 RepID=UPI0022B6B253|nr:MULTISPECIES: isoquinoline 1-oxidoreductase [unclassified Micromonospora]MCZ7474341.1 isoquinoline 1-oxidoreductase [Micromonospora sp. WMMC273]WBC04992.1 isoquinoline 1-oxidoreductase [Micromonospora sp. WMMA1976]
MTAPLPPFLGYVLAAPVLVAAAELSAAYPAARTPSPDVAGLLGLGEIMTAAALPGAALISVEVGPDGTVSFTLPPDRYDGDTSAAELIADGLSVPRRRVRVPPPRPAAGRARGAPHPAVGTRTPVRVAVAVARRRLLEAASAALGTPVAGLRLTAGAVTDRAGRRLDIGALAATAASTSTIAVTVDLTSR